MKRRVYSCALCRKRKLKCDATSWPCANCKRVGAECLGGNGSSENDAESQTPRSLVLWLQKEIASLEGRQETQQQGSVDSEVIPPATCDDAQLRSFTTSIAGQLSRYSETASDRTANVDSAVPRSLADVVSADLAYPRIGLSEALLLPKFVLLSEPRLPSSEQLAGPDQGQLLDTSTATGNLLQTSSASNIQDPLRSIPKQIADTLLETYISRVLPFYPIFYEPWLRSCHAKIFPTSQAQEHNVRERDANPREIFTTTIIMAVSLSTAARLNQARASEMAFRLFQHALTHIKDVLTFDISGLQSLVLLHTYALMNPRAANVYFLAGFIMQTVVDLGLHIESNDPEGESSLLLQDLRRRVFWTAWELDVSCNAGFTRPVALLPQQITTEFPTELEDSAIHPQAIDQTGRKSKFPASRIRYFRLVEVEVVSTMFHNHPITGAASSFEEWMESVETRIHAWKDEIHLSSVANTDQTTVAQWEEMALFADIADPLIILTLLRPCPRIPSPTLTNLIKAFKASLEVVRGYLKQASMAFGNLKYTFQPCHHVFSAALVFLHAIREMPVTLASMYTLQEMEDHMATFTEFFTVTSERWPASSRCLSEYQRILEPIRERYVETISSSTQESLPQEDFMTHDWPYTAEYPWENPDFYLDFPFEMIDDTNTGGDLWPTSSPTDWATYLDLDMYP